MTSYTKPLPTLSEENTGFWEGARQNELRMQKCSACGHIRYPTSLVCPVCLSDESKWTALSGRGTVYSYIIFHQVYNKEFAGDIPYNVALVQLDEGPRMFSNIVGTPNDQVKVGDRVSVVFQQATDQISIPRFQLIGE